MNSFEDLFNNVQVGANTDYISHRVGIEVTEGYVKCYDGHCDNCGADDVRVLEFGAGLKAHGDETYVVVNAEQELAVGTICKPCLQALIARM